MPNIAGKIRPSQLITTFGPGSIVNFTDDSVMITGIDQWPAGATDIFEPRLQKKWNLNSFKVPGSKGGIPSVSFPRYRVCPKCKSLRDNYERNGKGKYLCKCEKSGAWGSETHSARLIAACDHGHIFEFPWVEWAHKSKGKCSNPQLTLRSRGTSASALGDLIVECKCGASESMSGALSKEGLKNIIGQCPGDRPWLGDRVKCNATPRGMQKGATNVYFSEVGSSLSIPKYSNSAQDQLNEFWPAIRQVLESSGIGMVYTILKGMFPTKTESEIQDLVDAVQTRVGAPTSEEDFLLEEWNTFLQPSEQKTMDFETRFVEVDGRLKEWIEQVILVPRLREVRAIRGFRRIDPDGPISPITKVDSPFWLPGVEIRGEGVFIKFRKDAILAWEKNNQFVKNRSDKLFKAVGESEIEQLPRDILIHTFAHLLMRELSLVSGYSSSSIRERLYVGPKMHGLLLYTGSADSDGSLGGLVQHGATKRFYEIVMHALESARFCSSDPLCSDNLGGTFGKLNGAACYACSIVSETSCERKNQLLDRGLVVNLPGQPPAGFFE